jgi:hypothetical protein
LNQIDDTKDGALFIFTREEIEKNTDNIKLYNLFDNKYRTTNGTTRLQIQNGAFLYREQTGIGFNTKPFELGEKIKIPKEFKKDLFYTLQPELFKQMLYAPQILNAPPSVAVYIGEGWEEDSLRELREQTLINQKIGLHRSNQLPADPISRGGWRKTRGRGYSRLRVRFSRNPASQK